jgi:chemotaxis protein methyltransferase CheR
MKDTLCIDFLQWALPKLQMRWPGFRKVRRQVCKRIDRRCRELGLPDLTEYRAFLETHPEEWTVLDYLCRVSISRFYRDRGVFDSLRRVILPSLAGPALVQGDAELRAWSAGCASGEEIYTINLIWQMELQPHVPGLACCLVATDADPHLLQRARSGCYPASSLKELPPAWREKAFVEAGDQFCLRAEFKKDIDFRRQDIRAEQPPEMFHLIMCRNLVFTYFSKPLQQQLLTQILKRLLPGGALVIGQTEQLPAGEFGLSEWSPHRGIFQYR